MTAAPWLFVDGAGAFGGHQVMLTRWVDELASQGQVRPRVLARAGSVLRQSVAAHATGAALPERPARVAGIWARLAAAWRDARVIWRTIREVSPALVVVAEGSPLSQPLPALVCRAAGARVVVYLPLTQPTTEMGFRTGPIRDAVMKLGFAAVPHAWVVLTEDQAAAFARWTGARRPVFVLPNTVAREIEGRSAGRPARAEPAVGPLRVVVLGRLDVRQKGLDLLLDHLDRRGTDVAVSLVGDGPDRDLLAARISGSPRLSAAVRIAPWSDPIAALEASDVLLLPSRYEGVPLVMLEAMALGIPVVASELPGTRPFLPPECLFAVGDLERAFAILGRLGDPEARRRIADANQRTFAARASGAAFSSAVRALAQRFSGPPLRPVTATDI